MPAVGHEQQHGAPTPAQAPAGEQASTPAGGGRELGPPEAVELSHRLLARLGRSPAPREVVEALRQLGAASLPHETIAWALTPFGNYLTGQVMPLLQGNHADAGARSEEEPRGAGVGLGSAAASVSDAPSSAAGIPQHFAKAAFYKRSGGRRQVVMYWDGPTYDTAGLRDHGRFKKGRWTWDHADKVRVINLRSAQDPGSGESMEDAAKRWGATEIDYQTFASLKESTQSGDYSTVSRSREGDEDAEEGEGQPPARPPIDLDVDSVNAWPPDVLAKTSTDPMAPRRTTGEEGGQEGGVLEGGVLEGGVLEGSAQGDAVNGVDGGKGDKGNRGRKDGDKRGVSEAKRIGKQKGRGGGEGKVPVDYGTVQPGAAGKKGGSKQSMRHLLKILSEDPKFGWLKKYLGDAPSVELPESVAVAFDLAMTLKDAIEIATVFAGAMGMGGLLKGVKGAEEGAEVAARAGGKEAAEEGAEAVAKAGGKEAAEEGAEAAAKQAGKETAEEGAEAAAKQAGKETAEEGAEVTTKEATEESAKRAKNGEVAWVDEDAAMSQEAYKYQSGAEGARSNRLTKKSQAPKARGVKFDGLEGFEGSDGDILIDRKRAVVMTSKAENQALRQSKALEHAGLRGRWEVPTKAQATRAERLFKKVGVTNIDIKVVPE